VNKQEFSASCWRWNQGYTKMHGQPTIKTGTVVNSLLIHSTPPTERTIFFLRYLYYNTE